MCKLTQSRYSTCPAHFGTKIHLWCRECIAEAIEASGGRLKILPPEPSISKPPAIERRGL